MPKETIQPEPEKKVPSTSQRSPNYPSFSLSEAIAKARVLWEKDKKSPVPKKAALSHLGYGALSGPALRTLSSLKSYDLIRAEGDRIMLTDNAVTIILHDEQDLEYIESVRASALKPGIYSELYNQYAGHLPSDKALRIELIQSKSFNATKVDRFIADFRRTIEFAKLSGPLSTETNGSGNEEQKNNRGSESFSYQKTKLPQKVEGMRELRYTLASGDAIIYVPGKLQDEDFDLLKDYLELARKAEKSRTYKEEANQEQA